MRSVEETMLILRCEGLQGYRKWANKLPVFHFEKEA